MQGSIALQTKQKNGVVDHQSIDLIGENNRACCIINTVDPNDYNWEGKRPDDESLSKVQDDESPSKVQKIFDNWPKFVDVSDKMVREVDALFTANLTPPPLKCWDSIMQLMDLKYPVDGQGRRKSSSLIGSVVLVTTSTTEINFEPSRTPATEWWQTQIDIFFSIIKSHPIERTPGNINVWWW